MKNKEAIVELINIVDDLIKTLTAPWHHEDSIFLQRINELRDTINSSSEIV
jgi:hypothetical protein